MKALFSRDSLRMLVPRAKRARQVATEITTKELQQLIQDAAARVSAEKEEVEEKMP